MKLLKQLVPAFVVLGALAAGSSLVVRHVRTAPHETPLVDRARVDLENGVYVVLSGCFAESGEGSGLRVRAVTLSPSMEFVSEIERPSEIDVIVTNVSSSDVKLVGAERADSGESPATVRFSVALPARSRKDVELKAGAKGDLFSFFVVSDNHRNRYHVLDKIIADAGAEKPLFVFNNGDLVDCGTREQFEPQRSTLANLSVPYFTTLGNHDVSERDDGKAYVDLFGPTYYSFAHGNSYFIIVDNATGYISRKQLRWLRDALQDGKRFAHTFVFAHQPLFDPRPGHHHCMKPLIAGAEALMDLVEGAGVDFFFVGHLHSYCEVERNGVKYVISGGAGANMTDPFPYHHYLVITVDRNDVRMRVRLLKTNSKYTGK